MLFENEFHGYVIRFQLSWLFTIKFQSFVILIFTLPVSDIKEY